MSPFEQAIGYSFYDRSLLETALTHPSACAESHSIYEDNQRLEFLGDAVLQLALTQELFTRFPQADEGNLTQWRASLVSRNGLYQVAIKLKLGDHLILGKGEESSGGRTRPSNLADAMEALIGAIYLDSGFHASTQCVLHVFREELAILDQDSASVGGNPKGQLQEVLQSIVPKSPEYLITSEKGPDHCKHFVAEVRWENRTLGWGEGTSKKEAEIEAARFALEHRSWLESDRTC